MKKLSEILATGSENIRSLTNSPTSSSDDAHSGQPGAMTEPTRSGQSTDDSPTGQDRSAAQGSGAAKRSTPLLSDECPICRGAGYVTADVPVGHPDFGRAIPCRCREQERLERRIRSLQAMSSLSALQHLTFENFIPEPSHLAPQKGFNLRRAFETCVYFAEEPDGWLLLSGTFGCGKTHLAAAIANRRIQRGELALFMVVPDLLDHLRATYNPNSELRYDNLFEQLRSTYLLILDDLGTQSSTPWAQEKLFQLLNHRYNAHQPTVITTNQRLEDLEPRLRSRLHDPSLVKHYHIIAPDFRTGQNAGQSELSTLNLHREQQFQNFNVYRDGLAADEQINLKEIVATCEAFATDPSGWLVLSGDYGCGKTHLAAAIANHHLAQGRGEVMFVVVPDLLDYLRAAFSPNANIPYDRRFDEIKNAPMLVLDNLGTESATPWAREKLFQLLNYRYNAALPTVITTTSAVDDLEPWLRTRMFDTDRCKFCIISAPGYRRSRKESPAPRARNTRR